MTKNDYQKNIMCFARFLSLMLCMEAQHSGSAMQSTKLLQEALPMTENDDQNLFSVS